MCDKLESGKELVPESHKGYHILPFRQGVRRSRRKALYDDESQTQPRKACQ